MCITNDSIPWDLDFLTVSDAPVIVEELPVPVFLLGLPALVILIPRSCSEEGIEEFTELGVVAQLVAPLLPPVTTVLEPHKPFIYIGTFQIKERVLLLLMA